MGRGGDAWRRPMILSRALRYSARKPKPAKAALEWPEGKDICASLTSWSRPVQRVAAVCYAAGLKGDGFEGRGGMRGWQAERKWGRRPPMNHLRKHWRRVAVARA